MGELADFVNKIMVLLIVGLRNIFYKRNIDKIIKRNCICVVSVASTNWRSS